MLLQAFGSKYGMIHAKEDSDAIIENLQCRASEILESVDERKRDEKVPGHVFIAVCRWRVH